MRATPLLVPAAALVLGLTLAPVADADPPNAPGSKASPTGQEHRAQQAEQALAEVEALFDGRSAGRPGSAGSADAVDGRSATIALRDLRILRDALPPDLQPRAQALLQRPATTTTSCATNICVHYKTAGGDAPNLTDVDVNGHPDYVDAVRDTVQQIHETYVAAGYRAPLPDGTNGGNAKTDIYIENLGADSLYGYCQSDDPKTNPAQNGYDLWAYCALDNDYSPAEFGNAHTPLENMQVTAAHEYFHAVQFAYDYYEDRWILESTAAWVEDEVFDAVNDNRQYLANSPLRFPQVPMDTFGAGFHYGTWIFWRYLTERYQTQQGGLPTLVRDVWRRLDGSVGGPDQYSTQGLRSVLAARGTSLPQQFARFAAANRHPKDVYSEGAAAAYKPSPATVVAVRRGAFDPGPFSRKVDHLASTTVRYQPRRLTAAGWKLRLAFNLQDVARGSAAVVTVYKRGGGTSTTVIRLTRSGAATKTLPFSSRKVAGVDVTLVNTSSRFICWQNATPYSCFGGIPRDDNLKQVVDPRAFRR